MDKIPFEDGVKLKNATVNIDGKEHEVTPAQYQGTTPVSSLNLNKMQSNIENTLVKVSATEPNQKADVWLKKGKNLISIDELSNYYINESNGNIAYNNTKLCSEFIYLGKGTYTISCNLAKFSYAIYNKEDKSFNRFVNWSTFPAQIVIENDCFVRVQVIKNNDASIPVAKQDISFLQLEPGDTSSDYEKYIEPNIYVNKNGNYVLFNENKIILGDIIERNSSINFTTVDIVQYGKIVNISLELDCNNISLTSGQVKVGTLSGVARRKEWIRYGMFLGENAFNYKGIGRLAINPETGEIFIEDNNGVGQKTVIFSYSYIVE